MATEISDLTGRHAHRLAGQTMPKRKLGGLPRQRFCRPAIPVSGRVSRCMYQWDVLSEPVEKSNLSRVGR